MFTGHSIYIKYINWLKKLFLYVWPQTHRLHSKSPRKQKQKQALLLQKVQTSKRRSLTHTQFWDKFNLYNLDNFMLSISQFISLLFAVQINFCSSTRWILLLQREYSCSPQSRKEKIDGLIDHLMRILFTLFFFVLKKALL